MKENKKLLLILKEFNSRFPKINEQCNYLINDGGCGIFAKEVFTVLESNGFKPELVLLFKSEKDGWTRDNVNLYEPSFFPWHHIMVKVEEYYIDSEGVYSELKKCRWSYCKSVVGMKLETLEEWINQDGWNWMFDRRVYNPLIELMFFEIKTELNKSNRTLIEKLLF
jgi:hypothetical protein